MVSAKELGINTSRLVKTKFLGHWKSAFKGEGITFADIREYMRGDPRKRIDRRTTAKKGGLYVKEYEEERQLKIVIAQDCGQSMNFGLQGTTKKQQQQTISAVTAYAAASYGDMRGSVLFDQSVIQWMPPKKGMRTYFQTIENVKQITSAHEHSRVQSVVQFFLHNKIRHTLLFIVCDDFIDDCPGLRALSHYNDVVFLHCFDDYEMTMQSDKKHGLLGSGKSSRRLWFTKKTTETYARTFEEKRAATQQYVTKQGASYWLMKTSDDPVTSLVEFFMKKSHHTV